MSKTIKRNCILSARSRRLIEHIIKQKSNKAEKRSVVLYALGALFFRNLRFSTRPEKAFLKDLLIYGFKFCFLRRRFV